MCPCSNLRTDYEYAKKGSNSIFMFTEPLAGWRHVSARKHHTAYNWVEDLSIFWMNAPPPKSG